MVSRVWIELQNPKARLVRAYSHWSNTLEAFSSWVELLANLSNLIQFCIEHWEAFFTAVGLKQDPPPPPKRPKKRDARKKRR